MYEPFCFQERSYDPLSDTVGLLAHYNCQRLEDARSHSATVGISFHRIPNRLRLKGRWRIVRSHAMLQYVWMVWYHC